MPARTHNAHTHIHREWHVHVPVAPRTRPCPPPTPPHPSMAAPRHHHCLTCTAHAHPPTHTHTPTPPARELLAVVRGMVDMTPKQLAAVDHLLPPGTLDLLAVAARLPPRNQVRPAGVRRGGAGRGWRVGGGARVGGTGALVLLPLGLGVWVQAWGCGCPPLRVGGARALGASDWAANQACVVFVWVGGGGGRRGERMADSGARSGGARGHAGWRLLWGAGRGAAVVPPCRLAGGTGT